MALWDRREDHGEILREATRLVEAGKIIPPLDHRHFTLATVRDAYRAIKTGPVAGKIGRGCRTARSHRRMKPRTTIGNVR